MFADELKPNKGIIYVGVRRKGIYALHFLTLISHLEMKFTDDIIVGKHKYRCMFLNIVLCVYNKRSWRWI